MRYYQIDILSKDGGDVERSFTSYPNGKTDPNALNIEMDVFVAPFSTPVGGSYVRVWGISIEDIGSAADFNGKGIAVYGGMQKGLPLANPDQAGLLFQGTILQAFGNWVDTDQFVAFYVQAGADIGKSGTGQSAPKNLTLDWKKGTPLADAIQQTLKAAYPDFDANINISPDLKLNYDAPGYYSNLNQFASLIRDVSQRIIGGDDYPGVQIILKKDGFDVYDGTTQTDAIQVEFRDLIGQPTWIESPTIQLKAVMRADLNVGDYIKMPNGIYTTTEQAQSFAIKTKSAFQGSFQISSVRHLGNYRQSDASSWVTVIEANPTKVESADTSDGSGQ